MIQILFYLLALFEGHRETVKVKGIFLLEVPAESEVVDSQMALVIVMGEKLHVKVYIFDDSKHRLAAGELLLKFSEISDGAVDLLVIFATGEIKERVVKYL